MLLSVACLSIRLDHEANQDSDPRYVYFAILTVLCAPLTLCTKDCVLRRWNTCYDAVSQTIDAYFIEDAGMSLIFIYLVMSPDYTLTMNDLLVGTAAGMLINIARIFMGLSVSKGIGSCARSIGSSFALWQTLWSVVLDDQSLTWLQGVGIFLLVNGVFFIGVFEYLLNYRKEKKVNKIEMTKTIQ